MKGWDVLALFLATLFLSAVVSPWWNPWYYSLSALGSASNGFGGALYNAGVALTGLRVVQESKSTILTAIGALTVLVAAINIDFGIYHIMVATLLFLLMLFYVILYGDVVARGATVLSLLLWGAHFLYGTPPGIALPELSTILPTLYTFLQHH